MDEHKQAITEVKHLFETGFVLIDLETTGLITDPRVEIIEVAIITHQGEVLLNSLVKPKRRISPEATKVHRISNKNVAGAPDFRKIYPQLVVHLHKQRVVAYNVEFEQKILAMVCNRYEQAPIIPNEWHCAMQLYAAFKRSERFFRLGMACENENILVDNAHRALGDCRMTLALLHKIAEG